jgi:hypothetical protein
MKELLARTGKPLCANSCPLPNGNRLKMDLKRWRAPRFGTFLCHQLQSRRL